MPATRDPRPVVVVATQNAGKVSEIEAILTGTGLRFGSLTDFQPVAFLPEGGDYTANAEAKARSVARQLGVFAVADDSGLEVDALSGAPGPYSARFGGPDLDDAARVRKLLEALDGVDDAARGARFVCVAALSTPAGETASYRGECAGRILRRERGRGGFGYDPVFQLIGQGETMAELPAGEKNRVSHRAQAFLCLAPELERRIAHA